jgi:hypothetical protein
MVALVLILFIKKWLTSQEKELVENDSLPEFHQYTSDKFKFWKWSWEWRFGQRENAWIVNNLRAHCPNCDTTMIESHTSFGPHFECPRCEFRANEFKCDKRDKVERVIIDNIERRQKSI